MICVLVVSSAHAISFPGRSKQKAPAAETSTPTTKIAPPQAEGTTEPPPSQQTSIDLQPQAPDSLSTSTEAAESNAIPINLLELQFDQCVEQNTALGSRLVGSYCQCVATEYYQNLPHLGYLRFLDGLAAKEKDALKYEKQTSEFCFAAIAKMIGGPSRQSH